jgi:hypothetical protein
MDIRKNDPHGSIAVWPEKTYTQQEVDTLLENKVDSPNSLAGKIEQETQTADKQLRHDDRVVANLVKRSNRILVTICSHAFPFDFFPDVINLEEGRVTIINRHMFSSEVHSVDLKDISNIFINRSIIFAQLVFISNTFEDNEIRIKNLLPKDAVYIRRIIEGMRILESNKIDTSVYSTESLISKLEELSTTKIVV